MQEFTIYKKLLSKQFEQIFVAGKVVARKHSIEKCKLAIQKHQLDYPFETVILLPSHKAGSQKD